ncbi:dienelactone hydrolase family protein [Cryobacterium sp. SO2]|uniref:dienelactone hydrolase family protein n=1 Tax=Cryobacterium sp. SO2 TaxID=1897060 RepID=UPI00223D8C0B|nr:dienelactone hydrolase family protein [Cryobacterium sp. SO2]WEO78844.1 dienelactone hydrolase family protein [Cryobacterium sp. SO2]
MTQPPTALAGFVESTFNHDGYSHQVFTAGSGPAVVLIHEIPGLHPGVIDLARRLVQRGFRVYLPSLFGTAGAEATPGAMVRAIGRVCVSREFRGLTRQPPGATGWLRALARQAWADGGGAAADGPGVGVIGMCLTGGFALATALEPTVLAAVMSQPALPLPLGAGRASLGLEPREIGSLRERTAADDLRILGLRFTNDRGCPPERFSTLRQQFRDGFESIEIDSSPGNAAGIPGVGALRAHGQPRRRARPSHQAGARPHAGVPRRTPARAPTAGVSRVRSPWRVTPVRHRRPSAG